MSKPSYACPSCGNCEPLYVEDVATVREFDRVDDNGILVFQADSKIEWESTTNARLFCRPCLLEYELPDDVETDFF